MEEGREEERGGEEMSQMHPINVYIFYSQSVIVAVTSV